MYNTLYEELLKSTNVNPKAIALDFLGKKHSFEQLTKNIDSLALGLVKHGIKKDTVVTVCLPNYPFSVMLLYALNKIGAIVDLAHPETPPMQLKEFMKTTGSDIVFLMDSGYNNYKEQLIGKLIVLCSVAEYLPKIKGIALNIINSKKLKGIKYSDKVIKSKELFFNSGSVEKNTDYNKASVYIHSGGTTDMPKTIILNDYAMNNLSRRGLNILGMTNVEGKGMLGVLPIFHGFGLCMGIHTILCNGGISVLFPKFMLNDLVKAIRKGKISFMTGVPTMYEKLLTNKKFKGKGLQSIRFAFCGGDSLPQNLKERFDKALKDNGSSAVMYEGYGLTETITVCAVNNDDNNLMGSVGKPLERIEISAIDENSKFLPKNEMGELVVAGDILMVGYLNDDAANERVFFKDDNGKLWVRTGDLGYVDDNGFVWFKQRIKRMIKVNGMSIFPSEIESIIEQSGIVARACAIGVSDKKRGQAVKLFVSKLDNSLPDVVLKTQLMELCSKKLIRWAHPKEIEICDNLPLTMIGKVDFKQLMDRESDK